MVGYIGSPRGVHAGMTLTRSKVTGLLKFRKLHFSKSISSAISTWSSKVMVDDDGIGPSLQLVGVRFSNFLLRKLSPVQTMECRHYTNFKWPYIRTA